MPVGEVPACILFSFSKIKDLAWMRWTLLGHYAMHNAPLPRDFFPVLIAHGGSNVSILVFGELTK